MIAATYRKEVEATKKKRESKWVVQIGAALRRRGLTGKFSIFQK